MSQSVFDLTGRVAIVTGAAGGIGRATAALLASQGAAIVATDIDAAACAQTVRQVADAGGEATARALDVRDAAAWTALVKSVEADHGRLDALVNNAGVMVTKPFLETTDTDFALSMEINSTGVFLGSRTVAPLMIETAKAHDARPSIVNLSSIYGQIAGPAHVAYSASKGAVRAMSKSMAAELAPHAIRVNSVHPGPVNTGLLAGAIESLAERGRMPGGAKGIAAIARAHPMGRPAEAGDIASVIAFLCSDASAFMTGAELVVDGGYGLL